MFSVGLTHVKTSHIHINRYIFRSFWDRDSAFTHIDHEWQNHKPDTTTPSLTDSILHPDLAVDGALNHVEDSELDDERDDGHGDETSGKQIPFIR
jgi:hypothetical protein